MRRQPGWLASVHVDAAVVSPGRRRLDLPRGGGPLLSLPAVSSSTSLRRQGRSYLCNLILEHLNFADLGLGDEEMECCSAALPFLPPGESVFSVEFNPSLSFVWLPLLLVHGLIFLAFNQLQVIVDLKFPLPQCLCPPLPLTELPNYQVLQDFPRRSGMPVFQ